MLVNLLGLGIILGIVVGLYFLAGGVYGFINPTHEMGTPHLVAAGVTIVVLLIVGIPTVLFLGLAGLALLLSDD